MKLLHYIRGQKYDLIVNLKWSSEIMWFITIFGNSRHTAGEDSRCLRKYYNFSPIYYKEEVYIQEYLPNLRVVEAIGFSATEPKLCIYQSVEDQKYIDNFFIQNYINPLNTLVLAPFASTLLKAWSVENFIAIGKKFIVQGGQIIITYAPIDFQKATEIHQAILGSFLSPHISINQLAALLARVSLVLCNNSGPMHVAFAVNTPVICLNTSIAWRPYGDWNTAITELPNIPSHIDKINLANETVAELLKKYR